MAKVIQDDLLKGLIAYLMERPAKEVMTALLVLQQLPDAPEMAAPVPSPAPIPEIKE